MSEADKIIESLKNSGRKVEEFYTGNKTSDKNVGSIDKDIKNIKQYINLVLDKGYCDCNELNVISTGKYCDGSKNVAYSMQNLLEEREQDKNRIKELEEEIAKLKTVDYMFKIDSNENRVDMKKIYFEWLDSIPKQVVIDELKRLNTMVGRTTGERIQKYTINEIIIRSNALQELLGGKK